MSPDTSSSDLSAPQCLVWPQISVLGEIGEDTALEATTPGGDAEIGRRMVLEIENARARMRQRFVFLGKTQVFSAGVTLMSAFPREDRYLTRDAVLLIHCRQLDKDLQISGPMRGSLPKVEALKLQIEVAVETETENFRRLIEGSDIKLDELCEKAIHNWYLSAERGPQPRPCSWNNLGHGNLHIGVSQMRPPDPPSNEPNRQLIELNLG